MDEPLSNLDAKLRVEMRSNLQTLHTDLGITTRRRRGPRATNPRPGSIAEQAERGRR
jgi:hypothetical protein